MRYEARWSNGHWKTFDTVRYTDAEIHGLKAECLAHVAKMNERVER